MKSIAQEISVAAFLAAIKTHLQNTLGEQPAYFQVRVIARQVAWPYIDIVFLNENSGAQHVLLGALHETPTELCVSDGLKPASKAANKSIRNHIVSAGCVSRHISTATIRARSLSPEITIARTDAYQRDHLMRIAGSPDDVMGLNSVVVSPRQGPARDHRTSR